MRIFLFSLFSFLLTGCASIFEGYMSDVEIKNVPDGLTVYSADGVKIPARYKMKRVQKYMAQSVITSDAIDSTTLIIELRSSDNHLLILKDGHEEHRYMAYAKINPWWFILDSFVALPLVYDAITGNWNYFNDIEYR